MTPNDIRPFYFGHSYPFEQIEDVARHVTRIDPFVIAEVDGPFPFVVVFSHDASGTGRYLPIVAKRAPRPEAI